MDRKGFGYALLALVASSVALYFGTGLHPAWWLTWLAAIPVLLIAPRLSRRAAFAVAFLAWAAGGLNMWKYFRVSLSAPLAGVSCDYPASLSEVIDLKRIDAHSSVYTEIDRRLSPDTIADICS